MLKKICIKLIILYKKFISPIKKPCCIFYPTCSNYALDCYNNFGFFKASFLIIWRILRCNPFSKGGYDPIPLDKHK
ncbi:MAG: membrane protein insertion efficiency factor YidD [bacterium]